MDRGTERGCSREVVLEGVYEGFVNGKSARKAQSECGHLIRSELQTNRRIKLTE